MIGDDEVQPVEKSKGGVRYVQPFVIVPGILSAKNNFEGVFLKGLDDQYDQQRIGEFITKGSFINLRDSIPSRNILLSEQTAARMSFDVGDRLVINFVLDEQQIRRAFTISGIYNDNSNHFKQFFN